MKSGRDMDSFPRWRIIVGKMTWADAVGAVILRQEYTDLEDAAVAEQEDTSGLLLVSAPT